MSEIDIVGRERIRSDSTSLIYTSDEGEILYSHQVITLEGGDEPSESERELTAFKLAEESGVDVGRCDILTVPSDRLKFGEIYRVDPERKALIGKPIEPNDD